MFAVRHLAVAGTYVALGAAAGQTQDSECSENIGKVPGYIAGVPNS